MSSNFRVSSRYYLQEVVVVPTRNGQSVSAVKLRVLPQLKGAPLLLGNLDRLDIVAQRRYGDPTRFWHIADAHTELDATKLISEDTKILEVPET